MILRNKSKSFSRCSSLHIDGLTMVRSAPRVTLATRGSISSDTPPVVINDTLNILFSVILPKNPLSSFRLLL